MLMWSASRSRHIEVKLAYLKVTLLLVPYLAATLLMSPTLRGHTVAHKAAKAARAVPTRPPVWRLRRARHQTRSRMTVKSERTSRRSTKQRKLTRPRQKITSRATNRRSKTRPRSHFPLEPHGVLMVWICMARIDKRWRSSTRTSWQTKWRWMALLKELLCMSY